MTRQSGQPDLTSGPLAFGSEIWMGATHQDQARHPPNGHRTLESFGESHTQNREWASNMARRRYGLKRNLWKQIGGKI
jgi:hypothetical protein